VTQLAGEGKQLVESDQSTAAPQADSQPSPAGLDVPVRLPELFLSSTLTSLQPFERKTSSASLNSKGEPKAPWTPSYSVTSQGPGAGGEDADELEQLEQLEQLPPAKSTPSIQFPTEQPK
jgi:hypothetical protein